jgi:hypothetical protein
MTGISFAHAMACEVLFTFFLRPLFDCFFFTVNISLCIGPIRRIVYKCKAITAGFIRFFKFYGRLNLQKRFEVWCQCRGWGGLSITLPTKLHRFCYKFYKTKKPHTY